MKKSIVTIVLVLNSFFALAQASMMFERAYLKPYSIALTLTNPASAMSKYGGGLEYRRGRWAYTFGYYKYTGVYAGKVYDAGYKYYFRKQWRHQKNRWAYQDYFYSRFVFGESFYDGNKYEFLGLPTSYSLLVYGYIGAAAGIGRRYQKGPIFVSVRGGLKGTYAGLDEDDKIYYRLFYITGPGSILEVNAHVGIQF